MTPGRERDAAGVKITELPELEMPDLDGSRCCMSGQTAGPFLLWFDCG